VSPAKTAIRFEETTKSPVQSTKNEQNRRKSAGKLRRMSLFYSATGFDITTKQKTRATGLFQNLSTMDITEDSDAEDTTETFSTCAAPQLSPEKAFDIGESFSLPCLVNVFAFLLI
jgi:hypothetical protein